MLNGRGPPTPMCALLARRALPCILQSHCLQTSLHFCANHTPLHHCSTSCPTHLQQVTCSCRTTAPPVSCSGKAATSPMAYTSGLLDCRVAGQQVNGGGYGKRVADGKGGHISNSIRIRVAGLQGQQGCLASLASLWVGQAGRHPGAHTCHVPEPQQAAGQVQLWVGQAGWQGLGLLAGCTGLGPVWRLQLQGHCPMGMHCLGRRPAQWRHNAVGAPHLPAAGR